MQRHLICCDIDGTLSSTSDGISNATIKMIKELQAAGHIFYVATGRMFLSASSIAKSISDKTGVIASNGGILSLPDKISKHTLDIQSSLTIYQIAQKYHLPLFFFCHNGIYYSDILPAYFTDETTQGRVDSGSQNSYHQIKDEQDLLLHATDFINAIFISEDNLSALQKAKEEMMQDDSITVSSSFYNNIEITPKNISKAIAIKELQDYYQISKDNTISFGDGNNDIEMFKASKISVAMENANQEVKAHATHTTRSNNDDGVYHFLKQYFRNEEK